MYSMSEIIKKIAKEQGWDFTKINLVSPPKAEDMLGANISGLLESKQNCACSSFDLLHSGHRCGFKIKNDKVI
jgi:hypothetical protein